MPSFVFAVLFKVAPYSFMTVRVLMMRVVVICVRSHKIVGSFPDVYDVSIAKKSKVNSKFSRVSFGEFF